MVDFYGEKLEEDVKTNVVKYFYDTVNRIRQLSREVFCS